MDSGDILQSVDRYYSQRLREHGPTARGVDWNSPESQQLRFEQLLRLFAVDQPFSINDYGCGYGALADWLSARGLRYGYVGYDVSAPMIEEARRLHAGWEHCRFTADAADLPRADFTVASGIFNVKLDVATEQWEAYVLRTIDALAECSTRGFAFNVLTSYSDPERMRSDLYYADPFRLFDHCKRTISRHVSVLHDYELYEFTVVVKLAR